MADGLLYSKLQPVRQDDTILRIMESDRARRLDAHAKDAEKKAEYRANLFADEAKSEAEGSFLNQSVAVMNEVRKDKVRLWKEYDAGKITEVQFLQEKTRMDQIPLQIDAAYQTHEKKMAELLEGDPKLNYNKINQLGKAGATARMTYNPDTKNIDVNHSYIGDDGSVQKRTVGIDKYQTDVSSVESDPDQGVPVELAEKFGVEFEADLIKNNRTLAQGFGVGGTDERFETGFIGHFGTRSSGNNKLVEKEIIEGDERDTYEEAWDFLHNVAAAQVQNIRKTDPEPTRTTKEEKTLIQKNKITNLSKSGKGDVTLTEVTPLGSDTPVSGRGATFDVSNTDKTIEVTASDIEGVKEGLSEKIKVNAFFIDEAGDVYVKGSTKKKSVIEKILAGEQVSDDELFEDGTKYEDLDWVKIQGTSLDNLRTNLLGTSTKEALQYLKETSKGVDTTTENKEKPTAQELIAKYSK